MLFWTDEKNIRKFLEVLANDSSANADLSLRPIGKDRKKRATAAVYELLQILYSRQSSGEQESDSTFEANGQGFNAHDAQFLSDIARKSLQYRDLTPKQTRSVAKSIRKYSKQLAESIREKLEEKSLTA